MDHYDKMASNLLKDMGNKESQNLSENDGGSPAIESGDGRRIQERGATGKTSCVGLLSLWGIYFIWKAMIIMFWALSFVRRGFFLHGV